MPMLRGTSPRRSVVDGADGLDDTTAACLLRMSLLLRKQEEMKVKEMEEAKRQKRADTEHEACMVRLGERGEPAAEHAALRRWMGPPSEEGDEEKEEKRRKKKLLRTFSLPCSPSGCCVRSVRNLDTIFQKIITVTDLLFWN